jgi:glycosyltransferase involved in cell wall biosynthesis
MSYGLPIIVAKGDGTQEDLVTAENGWQIPPGDLNRLSEVLLLALRDKPGLGRKGEESYRIVSDRINIQEMVKVFINAFNEISTTKH